MLMVKIHHRPTLTLVKHALHALLLGKKRERQIVVVQGALKFGNCVPVLLGAHVMELVLTQKYQIALVLTVVSTLRHSLPRHRSSPRQTFLHHQRLNNLLY
jgi:hypothetical protein